MKEEVFSSRKEVLMATRPESGDKKEMSIGTLALIAASPFLLLIAIMSGLNYLDHSDTQFTIQISE